jgi:O-antigen ligase
VTREYGKNWPVVHNSYLVTWTEQGTAGFALLVGLYLTALWVGLTTARQLLDDRVYAISLGATCGIFAIMVDGYASFFIDEPAGLRVFWIVLALIFAAHYWTLANRRMRRATASRAVLRHVAAVST